MNLLLLFILVIELLVLFFANKKNVVSPSFIGCCGFVLSAFLLVISKDYFDYDIHGITIVIISTSLISIFAGEVVASRIAFKGLVHDSNDTTFIPRQIIVPSWAFLLLFIIVTASGFFYLLDAYMFSLSAGNSAGNIFGIAYYTRLVGGYSPNTLLGQANVLSESIIYFCLYVFFYNSLFFKKKRFISLLPLLGFVLHILANDGRTVIIKYLCIGCIMYFIMFSYANKKRRSINKKVLFIGFFSVALFLILFRILGYRTGSSINSAAWDNISEYLSSGIIGLDINETTNRTPNVLFGQTTFKALYDTLRGWGMNIPLINANRDFFTYAGGRSNVYTGIDGYIQDFSYIGSYISFFLWGVVIKSSEKKIRNKSFTLIRLVLLGLIYYPVVMISIGGATHVVLCMPTVYTIFYLWLLQLVFIRKEKGALITKPVEL